MEQVEELRNMLLPGSIRYDKEKVQSSHNIDRFTDTMFKGVK